MLRGMDFAGLFLSLTRTAPVQTYQWRLAVSCPKSKPMLHTGAERFVGNARKMSANRIRISVGALGRQEALPGFSMQPFTNKRVSPHFFTTTPFEMSQTVINIGIDKEKSDAKISTFPLIY